MLELIDSLQAIVPNINDACGGKDADDFEEAFETVTPILKAQISIIVKLQAQFEEHYPVATGSELKVLPSGGFVPPKRVNKIADIELTDEEWEFVDKWNGEYQLYPNNVSYDYISAIIAE